MRLLLTFTALRLLRPRHALAASPDSYFPVLSSGRDSGSLSLLPGQPCQARHRGAAESRRSRLAVRSLPLAACAHAPASSPRAPTLPAACLQHCWFSLPCACSKCSAGPGLTGTAQLLFRHLPRSASQGRLCRLLGLHAGTWALTWLGTLMLSARSISARA